MILKSKLSSDAITKLRVVQTHILEDPKRINMENWLVVRNCESSIGCIVGWLLALNGRLDPNAWSFPDRRAAQLLNFPSYLLDTLFYLSLWPKEMSSQLDVTEQGTFEYAQIVSDRINQFIEEYS